MLNLTIIILTVLKYHSFIYFDAFRSLLKLYFLSSETFDSSCNWFLFHSNDQWHFSPLIIFLSELAHILVTVDACQFVLRLNFSVDIIVGLNVSIINISKQIAKHRRICKQRIISMSKDYRLEVFSNAKKSNQCFSILEYISDLSSHPSFSSSFSNNTARVSWAYLNIVFLKIQYSPRAKQDNKKSDFVLLFMSEKNTSNFGFTVDGILFLN